MKTRAEVVGMPEIVAKRREVQAAYARLGEARKRIHGAPWWDSGRDGTYEAERDAAEAEHARLTADYEQAVTAAMSQMTRLEWAQQEYDRLAPPAHTYEAGGAYIGPFLKATVELVRAKHEAGIPLVDAQGFPLR